MPSRDANARAHNDYHAMVTHAAYLASVNRGECFHVYFNGEALFVTHSAEAPPPNATILCIAQHHSSGVVQVRFSGAWSEFRNFPRGASSPFHAVEQLAVDRKLAKLVFRGPSTAKEGR